MKEFAKYLLILSLILFYSCRKEERLIHFDQIQGKWTLLKFVDKATQLESYLPEGYTAGFTIQSDYSITISAPCNTGSGKVTMNKNKVMITRLVMTERACSAINDENKFTANLSGQYEIFGDTLLIVSDFDTNMVLIRTNISH